MGKKASNPPPPVGAKRPKPPPGPPNPCYRGVIIRPNVDKEPAEKQVLAIYKYNLSRHLAFAGMVLMIAIQPIVLSYAMGLIVCD